MKFVITIDVHDHHPLKDLPPLEPGEVGEFITTKRHYFAAKYVGLADDKDILKKIKES